MWAPSRGEQLESESNGTKEDSSFVPGKKVGSQVVYPELSYQIIGIAAEIHKKLGPGFSENIYEAAFMLELQDKGICYEQQKPIQIIYKQIPLGTYRLDLVVDEKIIVELKAVNGLNDIFKMQLLSYLKASGFKLGLLINFGARQLEHKRVLN